MRILSPSHRRSLSPSSMKSPSPSPMRSPSPSHRRSPSPSPMRSPSRSHTRSPSPSPMRSPSPQGRLTAPPKVKTDQGGRTVCYRGLFIPPNHEGSKRRKSFLQGITHSELMSAQTDNIILVGLANSGVDYCKYHGA
jgi:hypothetical protein